ncbi:DUF4214 domain-containing protein [Roseomonas sp. GCM10028921]
MTTTTDPLLSLAYHLRTSAAGSRIEQAWSSYAGTGIRIGLIDDGIWFIHPEIMEYLDFANSWNFREGGAIPWANFCDPHGTAAWGVIGSPRDNGTGTAGVAYDAHVSMLKIGFTKNDSEEQPAAAFRFAVTHHDVVSSSWGYTEAFADDRDLPALQNLFSGMAAAAASGRGGLGTVLVFSSGNMRSIQADTNQHGMNASPYGFAVAAVDSNGQAATFSTPGASVLIAAAGVDIPTTDMPGGLGYQAGSYVLASGTSFSAPIIAGISGLILDANAALGARDVQEILAYSAHRAVGVTTTINQAGNWNGGGLIFSNDVGFGIADALAATRLAESWFAVARPAATYSNMLQSSSALSPTSYLLPENGSWISTTLSIGPAVRIDKILLSLSCDVNLVAEDIVLVSPDGTQSRLLTAHTGLDDDRATWATPFDGTVELGSNAFWGEDAQGAWTVLMRDARADGQRGWIGNLQLTVHGDMSGGSDRFVYTDEFVTLANGDAGRRIMGQAFGTSDILDASAISAQVRADLGAQTASFGGISLAAVAGAYYEHALGGDGADVLSGSAVSNVLWGGRGDDTLRGSGGDDELRGGEGDDILDGGDGIDTAFWFGVQAAFTIERYGDGRVRVVQTSVGGLPESTDILAGIEYLAFGSTYAAPHAWSSRVDVQSLAISPAASNPEPVTSSTPVTPAAPIEPRVVTLVGAAQADGVFRGTPGDDAVALGDGGAKVVLGYGSDLLTGGAGHDILFAGGAGEAVRVLARGEMDITVTAAGSGVIASRPEVSVGAAGQILRTEFSLIEEIRFADGYISYSPNSIASSVERLYSVLLGRPSDPLGLASWTAQIERGNLDYNQMAEAFLNSAEGSARFAISSNNAYAASLYRNALGREGGPDEVAHWAAAIDNGGLNRTTALVSFASSDEAKAYQVTTGKIGHFVADWEAMQVARTYWTALGRDPELGGLTGWTSALKAGQITVGQLTDGFVDSPEFQIRYGYLDDAGFIDQLYRSVLNRAADHGGASAWLAYMQQGADRGDVILGFLDSTELMFRQGNTLGNGIDLFGIPV